VPLHYGLAVIPVHIVVQPPILLASGGLFDRGLDGLRISFLNSLAVRVALVAPRAVYFEAHGGVPLKFDDRSTESGAHAHKYRYSLCVH